jgi:hypothetical protein
MQIGSNRYADSYDPPPSHRCMHRSLGPPSGMPEQRIQLLMDLDSIHIYSIVYVFLDFVRFEHTVYEPKYR